MSFHEEKLIRDFIPDRAAEAGAPIDSRIADDQERRRRLLGKLLEEAWEVILCTNGDSWDHQKMMEEIGDVRDVLDDIVEEAGLDQQQIEEMRREKTERLGRFRKGVVAKVDSLRLSK